MERRPEAVSSEMKERLNLDRAISTWSAPQHMTYSSKLTRFRSFINWPHSTSPSPEELSSAGFFYTGKNFGHRHFLVYYLIVDNLSNSFSSAGSLDKVVCFHCAGGLMIWVATDNPWEEHSYHFPTCVYVRYIKGTEYVKSCKTKRKIPTTTTGKTWNCNLM
jgi:E3 ubiquitin-protein ligase XIAP